MRQSPQATIIDVRTRAEFAGGHVAGSYNISLNELPEHLEEISKLQPAMHGARERTGNNVPEAERHRVNGGGWTNVNYYKNNQS